MKLPIRFHGVMGIVVMLFGTAALVFRSEPVLMWITPIMWTGYIIFLDSLIKRLKGRSFILERPGEFIFLALLSFVVWEVFEGYNLRIENWHYMGMPGEWWVRYPGYVWSFATIMPGVLLTAEVLTRWKGLFGLTVRKSPIRPGMLNVLIAIGAVCVVVPLVLPKDLAHGTAAMVWVGFVFLLDPINYKLGVPSLIRDLEKGNAGRLAVLLVAGLICGFLWEVWNFWAVTKWVYDVPILAHIKIFEMPVVGFLGFPPFALELFVIYTFVRKMLGREVTPLLRAR